jgi:hypothetical protein
VSPARIAVLAFAAVPWMAAASPFLKGRVVDDSGAPIANARVSARPDPGASAVEAASNAAGAFELALPREGRYLVSAERLGYFRLQDRPVDAGAEGAEVTLVLNPQREVFQSVEVGESPSPVDPQQTHREERLSGTEINDIPYPASHSLRNAMKLMPGVVEDASGGVHFHGGAEYQTAYTLDGFDIGDPINGRFSTLLAVEGIRSLDLTTAREAPEYGRGSAGTLAIHPENGTDKFRFTATNFIPGLDTHGGLHIGDWTPRAGFSGPLVRGRAWFSDSFNGEYNRGYVSGLPAGQDTNAFWTPGNLFHAQANLTPANILYGDFLSDFAYQAHSGLGPLDPVSTTVEMRSTEWLGAVRDTQSWGRGTVLETGFGWLAAGNRGSPRGTAPYLLTPNGRMGNYFAGWVTHGRRAQFFAKAFTPAVHFAGRHQLQFGTDVQRLGYSADVHRTEFEIVGLSGLPSSTTSFPGSGNFSQPDTAVALFASDHWQPHARLAIDLGLREDWFESTHGAGLAPRISLAWSPAASGHTKLTAGYAILHQPPSLALLARPLDQQAVTTPYDAAGVPQTPLVTAFRMGGNLAMPRFANWSAGLERAFGHSLSARAEWLRKRGRDGLVYASATPSALVDPGGVGYKVGGTYVLSNQRRDDYDEAAIVVRQSFGDQYEWMASYVRSRAVSNAVLDLGIDQPQQVAANSGPMPWDAPNRLLSWAYLPFPFLNRKNWALSCLADWRSGFPFSIVDTNGVVSGPVDSHRYPSAFDLNLYVERRVTLRGYRLALRGGVNNATGHRNPTSVNNTIASPNFLRFYGDEGRHFVVRIRVLGKSKI